MDTQRRKNLPWGVLALAAVNVLYFLYLVLTGAVGSTLAMAEKGALLLVDGRYRGGLFPLIASMFMHFDIHHLGGNLLMLLVVGDMLESRLGALRVLLIYLVTGLAGNGVSILWYGWMGDTVVSAGASGAVYGMLGALFCLMLRSRGSVPGFSRERMLLTVFLMLYSGLSGGGINLAAHIGGLLSGFLVGLLFVGAWKKGKGQKGRSPLSRF